MMLRRYAMVRYTLAYHLQTGRRQAALIDVIQSSFAYLLTALSETDVQYARGPSNDVGTEIEVR